MPGKSTKKVIFFGASKSGKTSFLKAISSEPFQDNEAPTIGNSFSAFKKSEQPFRVWDLSGQEQYSNIARQAYFGVDIAVYVIDLSQALDTAKISEDIKKFHECSPHAYKLLLGTKSDLPRIVYESDLRDLVTSLQFRSPPFICSAKNRAGVDDFFTELADIASTDLSKEKHGEDFTSYSMAEAFEKADSSLKDSLNELDKVLKNSSASVKMDIGRAALDLVNTLASAPEEAITVFQKSCDDALHGSNAYRLAKNIVKAVALVAIAATVLVVTALIGFGIGFAAGAWTGPGAFISGFLAAAAAPLIVVNTGVFAALIAGAGAGISFFKPTNISEEQANINKAVGSICESLP